MIDRQGDLDGKSTMKVGWIVLSILVAVCRGDPLRQWSPTLGLQTFLDFNSQKSWPAEVVVKASGSCSSRTSGGPRLRATALRFSYCIVCHMWHLSP